jgi:AMP-binding enzyme C-terminal domain
VWKADRGATPDQRLEAAGTLTKQIKNRIGVSVTVDVVEPNAVERSEGKAKRPHRQTAKELVRGGLRRRFHNIADTGSALRREPRRLSVLGPNLGTRLSETALNRCDLARRSRAPMGTELQFWDSANIGIHLVRSS